MNIIVYAGVILYGLALIMDGYKIFCDKQYIALYRPNILKRATRVVIEGQGVFQWAVWQIVAGILTIIASVFMLLRNDPNPFGFIFVWAFIYSIMGAVIGGFFIGDIGRRL